MANRFLSNIKINDAYTFPASDGTNGQVIKTDGSGNLSFAQLAADSASVMYKDTFTGNGSTTAFTLANALNDEVQSNVYIDGVYQSKSTYSVSGTTLTFSTAPASGHEIEVISTTGINSGPTAIYTDTFTANGSATAFTLGQTVHDENQTIVFLNGVYQFKNTYTLSGTTLTLDAAPANGVAIEVMSIGSAYSGGDILYDHDFTSAGLMTTNGSGVYSITANNSANWNTAYGWGDHSTQSYATQSYVGTQISNLVDSSPATLNTLNELAAALGDDPNFATTTANSIGTKMPLAGGTFTGNVGFNDSTTLSLGASGDLSLIHDATNSIIGNSAGNLIIRNDTDDGDIIFQSDNGSGGRDNYLTIDGGVERIFVHKLMRFDDDVQLRLGDNNDIRLYHNSTTGNNNFENHTGSLYIANYADDGDVFIESDDGSGGTTTYLMADGGTGSLKLFYYGSKKFETTSTGVKVATTGINQSSTIRIQGTDGNGNDHPLDLKMNGADDSFSILIGQGGGATPSTVLFNGNRNGNVGIGQAPSSFANWRIFEIKGLSNGSLINFENSSSTRTGAIAMNDASSLMRFQTFTNAGITFEANNSERMRVTGDGKVGIGTTSPTTRLSVSDGATMYADNNYLVQIKRNATNSNDNTSKSCILLANNSNAFQIAYGGTTDRLRFINGGNVEQMTLLNGGNVGIGRTDPNARLDIKGAGGGTGLTFETSDGSNNQTFYVQDGGKVGVRYYPFVIGADSSTTVSGLYNRLAVYNASTRVVSVNYQDSINTIMSHAGAPNYGLEALTIRGDYIAFYTDYDTSHYQGVERMRINASGNVGIGPQSNGTLNNKLQVSSGVDGDGIILTGQGDNTGIAAGSYRKIGFRYDDTDESFESEIRFVVTNASAHGGQMEFFTDNTSGVKTRAITIDNAQRVGIGTTSPAFALDIEASGSGVQLQIGRTSSNVGSTWMGADSSGFHLGVGTYGSGNSVSDPNGFTVDTSGRLIIGERIVINSADSADNGLILYGGVNDAGIIYSFRNANSPGSVFRWYTGGTLVGSVSTTTSSTSFNTSSDYRLKENVVEMTGALDRVTQLKPSRFNFIIDPNKTVDGFLAHEVQSIVPEAISGEKDAVDEDGNPEYQGIDQSKLVPLLVGAIQELKAEIETLKTQINGSD